MYKLKVIKSKSFEAQGQPHTHYTAAYKGRVFGVSTLRFEESDLEVKDGIITIKTDIEVLKNKHVDALTGEQRAYLDIVPKVGISLAEF